MIKIWWLHRRHTGWAVMLRPGVIARVQTWTVGPGALVFSRSVGAGDGALVMPPDHEDEQPYAWIEVEGDVTLGPPV